MATKKQSHVAEVMKRVEEKNAGQDEFLQAVHEVVDDIKEIVEKDKVLVKERILERLTEPDRVITFRVCWEDDKGNVQINRGFRVQHCAAIGPYKGGLRFHPTVNLSVLKFLAFEQTFKNALTGLPMGGGKGGSDFNPRGRSDREIMRFCHAFMSELYRHIGPNIDVPAGDINVGAREIGFLYGKYQQIKNTFSGTLTGKGIAFGGSLGRTEATGYGLVYFVKEMLEVKMDSLDGKSVLVSGAGNVATHAAEKCLELGAKVLTFSNSSGTLFMKDGFSQKQINKVKTYKKDKMTFEKLAKKFGGAFHKGKNPWGFKADIALPCATQNELDGKDAAKLAKRVILVAEGANMPCTVEAIKVFKDAKIPHAPGKASNAGGVAVSGLEMGQNASFNSRTFESVDEELKSIMRGIHEACQKHGQEKDRIDYFKGANRAGFAKVAEAVLAYGVM